MSATGFSVARAQPMGWRGPLLYRLRVARHDPTALLAVLLGIACLYLVIAPIAALLSDAFVTQFGAQARSEEHTSELQSRSDLVCRLLLEKKKKKQYNYTYLPLYI